MMQKKKWMYNLFVVSVTELAILYLGFMAINSVFDNAFYPLIAGVLDPQRFEFWYWAGLTVLYLIPSAAVLLYIRATDREVLTRLAPRKGAGRALLLGSVAGAGMNLLCVLLAAATGSFALTFSGFTPLVLPLVVFCFFTCACEELLCRGYALEYLKKRYPIEVAAATGSVLFFFHHVNNLVAYGFNPWFALNVFLIGLLFVLITELTGSIWAAFGMHTLWNYTQQFVLGLPNSGASSSLSVFTGEGAVSGFFFDTAFGLEGAPGTTLVILIALAVLFALYVRRRAAAQA